MKQEGLRKRLLNRYYSCWCPRGCSAPQPRPYLARSASNELNDTEVQPKGGRVRISLGAQEALGRRRDGQWKPDTDLTRFTQESLGP
jgi:hypothetical protein